MHYLKIIFEKEEKMKKILILLLCLFIVGCGRNEEQIMEDLATKFYENYQKINVTLTNPTVSIADLKEADYDVSRLRNCTDSSYTELIINLSTREIESFIHNLDC